MPPSRPTLKRCTCEECIKSSPDGVLMDARRIPAHVNRVREEHAKRNSTLLHPAAALADTIPLERPQTSTDDLAARLFALTVTDNGPNLNSCTSKLWNSRMDFQRNGPSSNVVAGSINPLPISDIADSLNRLTLRGTHTQPPTEGLPSSLSSSLRDSSCTASTQITCRSPSPPANIIEGSRVPKKDRNQRSVKALELLANIDSRVQRCFRLLLDPSDDAIGTVSKELATLRQATENIRRNTDSVTLRKKGICSALDELELELKSRAPTEVPSQEPVEFITGESSGM